MRDSRYLQHLGWLFALCEIQLLQQGNQGYEMGQELVETDKSILICVDRSEQQATLALQKRPPEFCKYLTDFFFRQRSIIPSIDCAEYLEQTILLINTK